MGLAAAKKRTKLANDPNNTRWARNTESVGQRILRSQGWEPGQYLGAKDAPHAALHTAANASHIRAVLREDNLGLGAQRNRGDECTGLDAFQDLLGRLNGKTQDVLESEKKAREDVKLSLYVQRKLGSMNFVAGGFLIGDKVKEVLDGDNWDSSEEKDGEAIPTQTSTPNVEPKSGEGKAKRRKVESSNISGVESSASPRPEEKRRKKRQAHEDSAQKEPKEHQSGEKKSKKSKKRSAGRHGDIDNREASSTSQRTGDVSALEDKTSENVEEGMYDGARDSKKSRKEKRRVDAGDIPGESDTGRSKKTRRLRVRESSGDTSVAATPTNTPQTGASTPAGSGSTTPSQIPLRHLSRQKFIAQKRLSVLDQQALNQIFMIKQPDVPS